MSTALGRGRARAQPASSPIHALSVRRMGEQCARKMLGVAPLVELLAVEFVLVDVDIVPSLFGGRRMHPSAGAVAPTVASSLSTSRRSMILTVSPLLRLDATRAPRFHPPSRATVDLSSW